MAITKVSNSGFKTGVLKYDSFLAGNAAYDPAAVDSIATFSVTSPTTTITFSSIPSTYTHLQIRMITRSGANDTTGNDNIYIRYNSDTSSNYSWHLLGGNGTSTSTAGAANTTWLLSGKLGNGNVSNTFGVSIVDILDYANTNKFKTQRVLSGVELNGVQNANMYLASGSWRNTNAVNSITIINGDLADWVQYSHFALYGIKGAA